MLIQIKGLDNFKLEYELENTLKRSLEYNILAETLELIQETHLLDLKKTLLIL